MDIFYLPPGYSILSGDHGSLVFSLFLLLIFFLNETKNICKKKIVLIKEFTFFYKNILVELRVTDFTTRI